MGRGGTWPRVYPFFTLCGAVIFGISWPAATWARPTDSGGVYGRLDGDFALSPSVGLERYRGDAQATIGLQAMYLSTVGAGLYHADSRLLFGASSDNRSVTTLAVILSPLFLPRWSQAMEAGPALLDLTLDSFMLGFGTFWDYDRARAQLRRGTCISSGLSVPLLARASGPWLNTSVALRVANGPGFSAPADITYGIALSWAWFIDSKLHNDNP
jgi:hypothetical protein